MVASRAPFQMRSHCMPYRTICEEHMGRERVTGLSSGIYKRGWHMKVLVKSIAIALAAALFGSAASAQTTLTVGSKNFTEQFVVAELYAASLEAAGFKVVRKINLGATLVAHEALRTGAIDLYPEYTGTGVTAVMKVQGASET